MTIRHELLESLRSRLADRPTPRVEQVIRPPAGSAERVSPFTVVVLDSGAAGLCYNLLKDDPGREAYDRLDLGRLVGRDALALAADLLHPDLVHRLLGYAACSALSQSLFAAGEPAVDSTTDLLDLMQPGPGDHVGVVGDAPPLVREVAARVVGELRSRAERSAQDVTARAGQVTVVQRGSRRKGADHVRFTEDPTSLAHCNKLLLTSTSLLDDSFEELDRITAGASFRALYGPGAGILPDAIFARGFHAVAGTLVLDGAALARRQRDGEKWGDAKRKFVVTRGES